MCKVCERVDSLISAMENLYPLEDWKAILLDVLAEGDDEMNDIILTDSRNVWMNLIGIITAQWCWNKKIPATHAMTAITQHIISVYMHNAVSPKDKEPD